MRWAGLPLLMLAACAACDINEDPSTPSAVEAGDKTLIQYIKGGPDALSNCLALPNGGYDLCRFQDGAPIASSWNIILPSGSSLVGNQIVLFYRDIQKTYHASGEVISIPFKDVLQADVWDKSLEGEINALAILQYKDASGVIKTSRAGGVARLLVLPAAYSVLPLDSGVQGWSKEVRCKIQYATSGRSAYSCK